MVKGGKKFQIHRKVRALELSKYFYFGQIPFGNTLKETVATFSPDKPHFS